MQTTLDLLTLPSLRDGRRGPNVAPLRPGRAVRAASRARGARHTHRAEHYYVGRRTQGTAVHVVSATAIEPLEHHDYRSRVVFDWGAPTPGALELAYAMLAHSTESRPPEPICAAFWTEIVARLDRAGFVLSHGEVALWLLTAFCEDDGPPSRRRTLRPRVVGRLHAWRRRR